MLEFAHDVDFSEEGVSYVHVGLNGDFFDGDEGVFVLDVEAQVNCSAGALI